MCVVFMTSVMREGAGPLKRELQVARTAKFNLIELWPWQISARASLRQGFHILLEQRRTTAQYYSDGSRMREIGEGKRRFSGTR